MHFSTHIFCSSVRLVPGLALALILILIVVLVCVDVGVGDA